MGLISPGSGVRVPPGAYAPSFFILFLSGALCAAHLRAVGAKQKKEMKPKRRHAGLTQELPRWRN